MTQRLIGLMATLTLLGSTVALASPAGKRVFEQNGWTGHLNRDGGSTQCSVTRSANGVSLSVLRRMGGNAGVRVDFDPARVNDLSNFRMMVDGRPVRGPASVDETKGLVLKDFLGYDSGITQSILKQFRTGKRVTFAKAGADLPAISLQGSAAAIQRLDDCASWDA